jgi:hypothetical protein
MPDKHWKVTMEFVETATGIVEDTTFCLRETAPVGLDNLSADTVADDVGDWLETKARAMATSFVKLTRVRVNRGGEFGPDEGADPESGESLRDVAGTMASGSGGMPHGVCARVSVYSTLASRRGRGRFRCPSPTASSYLGTQPDNWNTAGAYYIAVKAFGDELLTGHDTTHDLVTHHYSLRVHSRADQTTRDAVRVKAQPQVSYLRSRITSP